MCILVSFIGYRPYAFSVSSYNRNVKMGTFHAIFQCALWFALCFALSVHVTLESLILGLPVFVYINFAVAFVYANFRTITFSFAYKIKLFWIDREVFVPIGGIFHTVSSNSLVLVHSATGGHSYHILYGPQINHRVFSVKGWSCTRRCSRTVLFRKAFATWTIVFWSSIV